MASFNFTVDTNPMAHEISTVSHNVNTVSTAVVAMRAAVIAAEQEGADYVCTNINRGFYALMHAQISQKIAQLTSTVEAKLIELSQYAAALRGIQSRMESDYHMISGRYAKTFRAINNNLEMRVAELDMPVFKLVQRDMKLLDNRRCFNSARFSSGQLESVLSSQVIAISKIKSDAERTLALITKYVSETDEQTSKSEASMENISIRSVQNIFLPVSIVETTTSVGTPSMNYYVAKSGDQTIDRTLDSSVRESSINAILEGNWSEIDVRELNGVKREFNRILERSSDDERVKAMIAKMFNSTEHIQQLNPDRR